MDAFLNLDIVMGQPFVDNYKEILKLDDTVLAAEIMVMKNILEDKIISINVFERRN